MKAVNAPRQDARILSRVLRIGLLLAIAGQVLWSFRPTVSQAQEDQLATGQQLYETSCSTCHGLGAEGTENGPSLQGVGPAAVDFMVGTGRMPLADPGQQPVRKEPRFTEPQIAAIVAYVASIAPGGPDIPDVDTARGDLAQGFELFLNNCSGCHGAAGVGDSVGGGQIAPSLYPPNATQIGEAIRIGPGVMPRFGEGDLSQADVDSIARYLEWVRDNGKDGGFQLGRVGAVAEGLIALAIGMGLVVLVIRLTGSKT
jgi:ubiquinol-cytochrome c reductase cytochrome c subunit